jgi:hypothetical protein
MIVFGEETTLLLSLLAVLDIFRKVDVAPVIVFAGFSRVEIFILELVAGFGFSKDTMVLLILRLLCQREPEGTVLETSIQG